MVIIKILVLVQPCSQLDWSCYQDGISAGLLTCYGSYHRYHPDKVRLKYLLLNCVLVSASGRRPGEKQLVLHCSSSELAGT